MTEDFGTHGLDRQAHGGGEFIARDVSRGKGGQRGEEGQGEAEVGTIQGFHGSVGVIAVLLWRSEVSVVTTLNAEFPAQTRHGPDIFF